jgi:hypothetical protein
MEPVAADIDQATRRWICALVAQGGNHLIARANRRKAD